METPSHKPWHLAAAEEAVQQLDTHPERGLDLRDVERRRERFGSNTLPPPKGPSSLVVFLLQFHQPLVYIMMAAGIVTLAFGEWVDSGVIFGVVLVNAVVGFIQETRASQALAALARTIRTTALIVRDGETTEVSSAELVPGDVVLLKAGDKVPADLRLLEARDLKVDESALTGESVAVSKRPEVLKQDAPLADRKNMLYSSSLVTYGRGTGVVVATGLETEVGRISELVAEAASLATPLTRNIARFSRVLLYVILALAGVTFLLGIAHGKTVLYMLEAAVALAVGAIPEALPAAVTVTLAIGVARMARRHAIIRKLPAVEALGSTTVICSDKTGTLTQNQMTVREIWAGRRDYRVSGAGFAPSGEVAPVDNETPTDGPNPALTECLTAGLLCNDSSLEKRDGRWEALGSHTEAALIAAAMKGGLDIAAPAAERPRIDAIPFQTEQRYMATLHDAGAEQPRIVYVKGAVENVLARCTEVLDASGEPVPVDPQQINDRFKKMAAAGMRVLAFACKNVPPGKADLTPTDLESGLTFLGLQGMMDPPRPEAIAAVRTCQRAGIRVKMITGDHAMTAVSIAKQVGLDGLDGPQHDGPTVITGAELEDVSDTELIDVADRVSVFARVTAEQKLRLVRALQARGHIVAMTGDGVNDAPALKQADIGVAMGVVGTEVAKEAADMVLTDDNFATIEAAVEEGRGVFDCLTKFIVWTLPTNLGDGLVIMAAVIAGVEELPIAPLQILWINMNAAVLLGLVLAFEPKESDIMLRPPRDPKKPILSGALVERIVLVGTVLLVGAFWLFWRYQGRALAAGRSEEVALAEGRTVAVNFFVFVQLFYMFNCRSLTKSMFQVGVFSNPWVWAGAAAMIALQIFYTYTPVMNTLFDSTPIGFRQWLWILGLAFLTYPIVGAEKWLHRRFAPGPAGA